MNPKPRVLILEDDPDIRLGWSLYLKRSFDCVQAEDSISGLQMARQLQPDAIVLDLGLPGGDGLQFLQRLRDIPELADTPVLVCSGRDASFKEKALAAGAQKAFQKPMRLETLHESLRDMVAGPRKAHRQVLIVEDDQDVREALAVRLRALDFSVAETSDGTSALVQARKLKPDLVVLDLSIPCGDGYTVLERMRSSADLHETPGIVLSAQEPTTAKTKALRAGANDFLQKPASDAQLVESVLAVI
ncbi:MAG: response regulator [Planctomycetota bacterium]